MRRVVKVLGGLALLALLAVALLVWKIEAVVLAAMTPGARFDAEVPPAAPDYGQDGSWSALPGRTRRTTRRRGRRGSIRCSLRRTCSMSTRPATSGRDGTRPSMIRR